MRISIYNLILPLMLCLCLVGCGKTEDKKPTEVEKLKEENKRLKTQLENEKLKADLEEKNRNLKTELKGFN